MSETKRCFVLMKDGKDTEQVFKGTAPRQCALKVANTGEKDIYLRERGTNKVHHYSGIVEMIPAPAKLPIWIKPIDGKIKHANVKKVGRDDVK